MISTTKAIRAMVAGWCGGVWIMLGHFNPWAYGISGAAVAFGVWMLVSTKKPKEEKR